MKWHTISFIGWLVAVTIATAIGLAAVSLLTGDLTDRSPTPLSRDAVSAALASSTEAPKDPAPTPLTQPTKATTTDHTTTRTISSPGGTIIARCTAATAYLVAWTPAQGFGVDKYARGPAESVLVQFDGNDEEFEDQEITMTVTCPAGEPVAAVIKLDD